MRTIINRLVFILMLAGGPPALSAAGNEADAPALTVHRASIVYVTRAGDTLSSIASRFTPRAENWTTLGKINEIGKDTAIPIGTQITIPADLLQDEPSEAKIVALSGNINASSAHGKPVPLGLGTRVTEGMQIQTGANSFLTLLLPDASRISLPSNSHIRIAKLRTTLYTKSPRTEILLLNGKIESRVAPLEQNKGHFEVRTPVAVAGVRGTSFRVAVGKHGTATEVLSGKVEVGSPASPRSLVLSAGQGNLIDAQNVGPAVQLLPAPQLEASQLAINPASTQFTLTPVAGAHGYHVQIATDPDAHNVVLEGYGSNNRIKLDGLSPGMYFARTSAIDQQGLEGAAHIQPVTVSVASAASSNTATPDALQVSATENRQLHLQWQGLPGQKFQVQIARDPAFSWLLYSRKTDTPAARFARPAFGTYYARVRATNPDGSATPYSSAQAFVVTDQWIIHDGSPANAQSTQLPRQHDKTH